MPTAGLRWGAVARAVAVYVVLALVADLSHAHVHLDEECVRCIVVEQGDTFEPPATSAGAYFAASRKAEAPTSRFAAWSQTPHQPRAPPTLS